MNEYTDEFLECLHTKCTANEDILNNSMNYNEIKKSSRVL